MLLQYSNFGVGRHIVQFVEWHNFFSIFGRSDKSWLGVAVEEEGDKDEEKGEKYEFLSYFESHQMSGSLVNG